MAERNSDPGVEPASAAFAPTRAIVTASDSGIGRATAIALTEAGMDLGITWHSDDDGARETAAEVERLGRTAHIARLDVTELTDAPAVVDRLADQLGGLDVFVNNAGTGLWTPFLEVSLEEWRRIIAANLDGAFVCMQHAARPQAGASITSNKWRNV